MGIWVKALIVLYIVFTKDFTHATSKFELLVNETEFNYAGCSKQKSTEEMKGENIAIVVFDTENTTNSYRKSMELYSAIHGYQYHHLKPAADRFNFQFADRPQQYLILYRQLVSKQKCDLKWILFLDRDVAVVELSRSIESVIRYANEEQLRLHNSTCDFIGQHFYHTINAGVLFFRVSPQALAWLKYWAEITLKRGRESFAWNGDQGWLQYTYLRYAELVSGRRLPLDCASEHQTQVHKNFCFAKMLTYIGPPGRTAIGRFCLLTGDTLLGRINMRDWRPNYSVAGPPDDPYLLASFEGCDLRGLLFYHSKSAEIPDMLFTRRPEYNMSISAAASYTSLHPSLATRTQSDPSAPLTLLPCERDPMLYRYNAKYMAEWQKDALKDKPSPFSKDWVL
jgi:hypothetical protein